MPFEDWSELVVRMEPRKRDEEARQSVVKHPLTGAALCGRCGSALGSTSVSRKHGRYHAYYRCSKRAKKGACEARMNLRVSELEAIFEEVLEGVDSRLRNIWADNDVENRRAFLCEHRLRIRVWQDLVPWTKYSAVVDFGDVTGMSRLVGLRLSDGVDRILVPYRCGEGDIPGWSARADPSVDLGWTDERKRGLLGAVASPRQG